MLERRRRTICSEDHLFGGPSVRRTICSEDHLIMSDPITRREFAERLALAAAAPYVTLDVSAPTQSSVPPSLPTDRKSTRLNSSHSQISYAVFCLKKKKTNDTL